MAGILNFTAIDVEIANSSGELRWSICQVGVAIVKSGKIVTNGSRLINPRIKDSEWSGINVKIHGIRPWDVRDEPTFKDIYPKIRGSVARGKIVSHMSHSRFDEDVIRRACERQGLPMFTQPWMDSWALARRVWPDEPSHSLPTIAPKLGIRHDNAHDAGEDARAAAELVLLAARKIGTKRVNDWLRGVKDF